MIVGSPFNRCVQCDEVITNPICASCLAGRMAVTIGEHDLKLAKLIKGFKAEGDTTCIYCGEKMGICAHCFSKDIYEFLSEKEPEIAADFLGHFDFELRRELV